MAYDIVWTETANLDLKELVQYIAIDDSHAALHFGNLVINRIEAIANFPLTGRIVPEEKEENLREVILSTYRLVYEIDQAEQLLYVVRIWHSAKGVLELLP